MNPDQTKRVTQIAILKQVVIKNSAAIHAAELTLQRMREKQICRLAELRMQELMLKRAQDLSNQTTTKNEL